MLCAELQANPDAELAEFLALAVEHSTASRSTVRKDFVCDDGILAVSSHDGGPVSLEVQPLPEE